MKITTNDEMFNGAIRTAYRDAFRGTSYANQWYFRYSAIELLTNWAKQHGIRPYAKAHGRFVQLRKKDWYITDKKKYMFFIMQYGK
jgi:hypothetical protein